ncbi:baseplate J/gp47 family protein [Pantoea agglomerans]
MRELDPEFDALVESEPAYKQGEINAYQLTLAFQRVNDAVRAVFLASARGADLDQLGAAFNVSRLVIDPGDPDAVPPVEPVYESDNAFRERIQLSWAQLNTAGARNAYRFYAKSADNDVLDADAYGPETHNRPGEVDVYVLSRTGNGQAGLILIETVMNKLSADEVRPLTDFVSVKSAEITPYTLEAELEIPDGPDAQTVLDNAIDVVTTYTELSHRINTLVPLDAFYASRGTGSGEGETEKPDSRSGSSCRDGPVVQRDKCHAQRRLQWITSDPFFPLQPFTLSGRLSRPARSRSRRSIPTWYGR